MLVITIGWSWLGQCVQIVVRVHGSLRKHPFLLALRRSQAMSMEQQISEMDLERVYFKNYLIT